MKRLMLIIRNRFHPIFHLRKWALFRQATILLDIPIAIHFEDVVHPVYVSLSKNLSLILTGGGAGEERERDNFIWLVNEGRFRSFLDVGANIGIYGFLFGSIVKDGIVTMIEPDSTNAKLIRSTVSASRLQVTLVEAAASNESGWLTFFKDNVTGATGSLVRSAGDSFIAIHHKGAPCPVSVKSISLDELFSADPPDFIKIDVEGAELKALRGGEVLLSSSHPALMFECDQDQETVRFFLLRHGYTFFDMESLAPIDTISHNCLALHRVKHATIISHINDRLDNFRSDSV